MAGFLRVKMWIAAGFAALLFFVVPAAAQVFQSKANTAYMIDADTGTILFSKDPDIQIPPASLAKIMTMEVVFHALKEGRIKLSDQFKVSEHAWRKGGAPSGTSTMFAALNSMVSVENLIRGVVIQSANDGCIVLAEGMAGSEEKFAELMNERARALGLRRSVFRNSTGLPAEGQMTTMREMATLGLHLAREYPDLYRLYAEPEFTWNGILQRNRNPLLSLGINADGLQAGFTEGTGFAIVGSVAKDGRRVVAALSGMANDKERSDEARRMLEWGMRAFEKSDIFADGEVVGEASVYGGERSGVPLAAKGAISILVPAQNRERLIARIVYEGPLVAPVEKGVRVGELRIWIGDSLSQATPLFTSEAVPLGSIPQRALDAIGELMVGWLRKPVAEE